MKITPTMKREHRNSGFASPVFHLNKWPGWSDTPYHRVGAAPMKRVNLPRGFVDICEDADAFKGWLKDQRTFWQEVARSLKTGTFIAID